MVLHLKKLSLNLPWGIGGVEIEVSQAQANAAWSLYVEMATRVATQPLDAGAGSILESLGSLYSLFDTTREVLREAGPDVANGPASLGPLAIRMLNEGLRPFLEKWHVLTKSESEKSDWNEASWDLRETFYAELEEVRSQLGQFIDSLARIAGIKD